VRRAIAVQPVVLVWLRPLAPGYVGVFPALRRQRLLILAIRRAGVGRLLRRLIRRHKVIIPYRILGAEAFGHIRWVSLPGSWQFSKRSGSAPSISSAASMSCAWSCAVAMQRHARSTPIYHTASSAWDQAGQPDVPLITEWFARSQAGSGQDS
jgi:hypothetical protein